MPNSRPFPSLVGSYAIDGWMKGVGLTLEGLPW